MEKRKDYISWDEYFMGVAILASQRSKDPSTQVGACIVDGDKRILSTGYNGFPQGCSDDEFPWNRDEAEGETKAQRGEKYASRTIDLDMMFYDEERICTERLKVPHPLIMEREFAIVPLCDLLKCSREELERKIYNTGR